MIYKEIGKVLENKALIKDSIYLITIDLQNIAKEALPGQFVEIKTGDLPLLRKPISIFDVDKNNGLVSLLYQVRGKGTKNLSGFKSGEYIDIIGPLGNGFTIDKKEQEILLVGGGIGIAPLYYLGKELKSKGNSLKFILGYSCKDESYAVDFFRQVAEVEISTMDGSLGCKGHVGRIVEKLDISKVTAIYACGPEPMLKYLKKFEQEVDLELSLEAYMGCGLGACISCVCEKTDGSYARVCKDGPVFKGKEISFNE
ncbi:MAG: dihydroorotate dehydrogenase electron transfer subunit [Fusobacteria bacterium]|nr:dihydroorotate dehydrogenase electron transfer subunit [Fusobacteriota bacterium]